MLLVVCGGWRYALKRPALIQFRGICKQNLLLHRGGNVLHFFENIPGFLQAFHVGPIGTEDHTLRAHELDDFLDVVLDVLADDSYSGPVNVASPNPVTNREFAKELGRAVNRPAVVPIPGFALGVLRGPEFGKVLQEGQRVFPKVAVDGGYEFKQPELAGALANLLR